MSSRRTLKAAEAIREVVSMAILAEIRDPRVRGVTVTHVDVAPDMKSAKVYVSVMGTETQQGLSLHGLQHAAGFLQAKISQRIDTRYTPRLEFVLDQGVKKSLQIDEILRRVLPKPPPAETMDEDAMDDDATDEVATDEESDLADEDEDSAVDQDLDPITRDPDCVDQHPASGDSKIHPLEPPAT